MLSNISMANIQRGCRMPDNRGSNYYEVVFSGKLITGISKEDALRNLSETFMLDSANAARALLTGDRTVLYKCRSKNIALGINYRLQKAGLRCEVLLRGSGPQPAAGQS